MTAAGTRVAQQLQDSKPGGWWSGPAASCRQLDKEYEYITCTYQHAILVMVLQGQGRHAYCFVHCQDLPLSSWPLRLPIGACLRGNVITKAAVGCLQLVGSVRVQVNLLSCTPIGQQHHWSTQHVCVLECRCLQQNSRPLISDVRLLCHLHEGRGPAVDVAVHYSPQGQPHRCLERPDQNMLARGAFQ